jgi:AraC-like DNA-binding protein
VVTARYAEQALHPALEGLVEAAWSVSLDEDAPSGYEHLVLPDGCIDIVLVPGREPFVAGPATKPSRAAMAPGDRTTGLRFRPGAAPFVLGESAEALRDLEVPLAALWGHDVPRDLDALQAAVARRLAATDPLIDAALRTLAGAPGTDVRELAREVGFSERHLRRRFQIVVGYGPKRFARILRLQRLLAESRRRPQATGAELAFAAGYADQPHMVREAHAVAGLRATDLLAERGRSVQAAGAGGRHAA